MREFERERVWVEGGESADAGERKKT